MNILEEIFAHKRQEVERQKEIVPFSALQAQVEYATPPRDFVAALKRPSDGAGQSYPALIAEVKCASPSRGRLVNRFNPLLLARTYWENGAAAISVLTDEYYFRGHLDDLKVISSEWIKNLSPEHQIPILRKDFIFDPYQIYEARCAGADAVLLIAASLEPAQLKELHDLARELSMTPLIEVHQREEIDKALDCNPNLVGVNNRNLADFSVDLDTALNLRPLIPSSICLVAESGIHSPKDVLRLASAGVDAVLVGEALVTAPDVAAQVRAFSLPEVCSR